MGTGKIKQISPLVFISLLLSVSLYGQTKHLTDVDGTDWNGASESFRLGTIGGFMLGTTAFYEALEKKSSDIDTDLFKGLDKSNLIPMLNQFLLNGLDQLTFYNISPGQLKDGVDTLYKDFSNRRIKVVDAVFIVKMQIKGENPGLIEAQIRYLKMQPINDVAREAAYDKCWNLMVENLKSSKGMQITLEDINKNKISLEEVLLIGKYIDDNNEQHNLFCYGKYK